MGSNSCRNHTALVADAVKGGKGLLIRGSPRSPVKVVPNFQI